MPPTPFLQNVGKVVATIMENLVSEDHFDDLGVNFEVSDGLKRCRRGPGAPQEVLGGVQEAPGGSAGSPEGSQGTFGSPWAASGGTLGINGGPQDFGEPFRV